MTKFCQAGNLKSLLTQPGDTTQCTTAFLGPVLQPILAAQVRGSLMTDVKAHENMTWSVTPRIQGREQDGALTSDERQALKNTSITIDKVQIVESIQVGGASYEAVRPSELDKWRAGRNATVLYRSSDKASSCAGRILHIVSDEHLDINKTFAIIQPYRSLRPEDQTKDPYRRSPELNAFLVYEEFATSKLEVVPMTKVICHAARAHYRAQEVRNAPSEPALVLISLDRVSVVGLYPRISY